MIITMGTNVLLYTDEHIFKEDQPQLYLCKEEDSPTSECHDYETK